MRTLRGYVTRAVRSASPPFESSRIARRYARVLLTILAIMSHPGCATDRRFAIEYETRALQAVVAVDAAREAETRLALEVASLRIQVTQLSVQCEELRTEILILKRRVKMTEP
jgi:hypothetical protein